MINHMCTVRLRTDNDLPFLLEINKLNHRDNGGTLIEGFDPGILLCYVFEWNGEVLGYMNIIVREPDRFSQTLWKKKPLQFWNSIYIAQSAIHPVYQGLGFGSVLYDYICKRYADRTIYAHVNAKDTLSMAFHYKQGFDIAGIYQSEQYRGIENYCAFLYQKNPIKQ